MKKTLRKPENWQDFESLCKSLWGEIWDCPEIKKNGRSGQKQNGVDVYGVPKGETQYYGIQCKGKDDYTNSSLTQNEVDTEINKAKTFKPKLKKFYFATTANKDTIIEEYIREKDIESRANGDFEIHLFSWEDIVDLLEENKNVLTRYLSGNNVKDKFDFEVLFNNQKTEIEIHPKYLKKITRYQLKQKTEYDYLFSRLNSNMNVSMLNNMDSFTPFGGPTKINRSKCKIQFYLLNTGNVVIENWKLHLWFDENVREVDDLFRIGWLTPTEIQIEMQRDRTTFAYEKQNLIIYSPAHNEPFIQNDSISFKVAIIPHYPTQEIKVKWELLARDFNKQGNMLINVEADYKDEVNIIEVANGNEVLSDKTEIVELIETK